MEKQNPCKKDCPYGKFKTIQCICSEYRIWSADQTIKRLRKETEEIINGKISIFQRKNME